MKKQSGSGLIFAVILLFVILGMVVTLSSITVLETKMSQKNKSSVGAFYNSESGVEWALNQIATSSVDTITGTFSSDSNVYDGVDCPFGIGGANVCKLYLLKDDGTALKNTDPNDISLVKAVRSVGSQGGETQRAIEAAVAAGDGYGVTSFTSTESDLVTFCKYEVDTGDIVKCFQQKGSPNYDEWESWPPFDKNNIPYSGPPSFSW